MKHNNEERQTYFYNEANKINTAIWFNEAECVSIAFTHNEAQYHRKS